MKSLQLALMILFALFFLEFLLVWVPSYNNNNKQENVKVFGISCRIKRPDTIFENGDIYMELDCVTEEKHIKSKF